MTHIKVMVKCVREYGSVTGEEGETWGLEITLHTYSPVKMEHTQCSEMLAFKLQTLGNHSKESIRHSEHCESLKSKPIIIFP
jgi:hypothetical protein